jgi:hypothetical protein
MTAARHVQCPACEGYGAEVIGHGRFPDGSENNTEVPCEYCEGTGRTEVDVEPITLDDLDTMSGNIEAAPMTDLYRANKATIDALAQVYLGDPKQARKQVDGVCEWSSDYTSTEIDEWAGQADTMAFDRQQLIEMGCAVPRHYTEFVRLTAAADALALLAEDRRREEAERDAWIYDDGCGLNVNYRRAF